MNRLDGKLPGKVPACFDIDKGKSIEYHKDLLGTLHVPKRKLDEIIHIDCF